MSKEYLSGRVKRPKSPSGSVEARIIKALHADSFLSNKEISEITGVDRSTVTRNTKRLTDMGILRISGEGLTESRTNKFFYFALVKASTPIPIVEYKQNRAIMSDDTRKIKRSSCSTEDVPYLNWWEGGGLYENLGDKEARLAA